MIHQHLLEQESQVHCSILLQMIGLVSLHNKPLCDASLFVIHLLLVLFWLGFGLT